MKALLQQALDALIRGSRAEVLSAVTALREAIAAPTKPINCGTGHCSCIECVIEPTDAELDRVADVMEAPYDGTFEDAVADALLAVREGKK